MIHRTPFRVLLALAPLLSAGCEEYYDVDAACHEGLTGGSSLDPTEKDGMLRINCYRRLTGLSRGTANPLLQAAADGEVNYVQQNPNLTELLSDTGALWWLTQKIELPGFTGSFLTERLANSGYTIFDIGGTSFWEFIQVVPEADGFEPPTAAEAIDELMRDPLFRQAALQPSVLDMAYSEGFLPPNWWQYDPATAIGTATGTATTPVEAAIPGGRVYYLVVMYQAPHFEHVDQPVLSPKEDQVKVPRYSWSFNRDIEFTEGVTEYPAIQISYPITLGMGSIDPENYDPIDQNQYSAFVTDVALVGPGGPLETEVVHPGDDAIGPWPSGRFLRTNLAIYARQPFAPKTKYQVIADLETPDGLFRVDYSFTTADDDPGLTSGGPNTTPLGEPTSLARRSGQRNPLMHRYLPGIVQHPPTAP